MHAENFVVDECGDWHAIEDILELFPDTDGVTAFALVVETIDAVDRSALVVTTQQEKVFGILDLVGKHEANSLQRLLSSVDIVTEEEVVGVRRESTILEQSQKIVVLTMNIT